MKCDVKSTLVLWLAEEVLPQRWKFKLTLERSWFATRAGTSLLRKRVYRCSYLPCWTDVFVACICTCPPFFPVLLAGCTRNRVWRLLSPFRDCDFGSSVCLVRFDLAVFWCHICAATSVPPLLSRCVPRRFVCISCSLLHKSLLWICMFCQVWS